ncbi:MAG: heme ABC transporter permease [Rhizobiaceae bacterium]|nr:heme ABC transporter permease [Rhizobiaceae bacterium]
MTSETAIRSNASNLWGLANPTRFMGFANRAIPVLGIATMLLFAIGLYLSFTAPEDYQQGYTVLIMFIHVPAAWLAMMTYSVMSISALGSIVWRHPLADVSLRTAAPLGAVFTFLALATGSLWGKPMWGTWWEWDARMTSVLILFIIYLGIIALSKAFDEPSEAAQPLAIMTLVGVPLLPIIKFSVDWWNTLHQPASVSRFDRPAMGPEFLYPLLIMALAYMALFFTLHFMSMRNEVLARRIRAMKMKQARRK